MHKFKGLPVQKKVFLLLLIVVLLDRYLLLSHFGFKFVGSDDTVIWLGAHDYMHGEFYTPYFYGQSYNFMLEAVFAIPLLVLQVPYYIALPLSTTFITLFPFFMFSYALFRRSHFVESMLFLLIPLFLPIEYGILTSISRGFASGLFFCGLLVYPVLEPVKRSSWIIAAFAVSFGYFVNPSSIIFSFPVCLYLLFHNYKSVSFYVICLLCGAPALIIEHYATQFVIARTDYNCHAAWPVEFKPKYLLEALDTLDRYLSYFTPLTWFAGWLGVLVIFLIGISLLKRDIRKALTLILSAFFIILSLGVTKVHDHLDTIFLCSARMYLCLPVVLGLALFWGRELIPVTDKTLLMVLSGAAIGTLLIKTSMLDMIIDKHTQKKNFGAVAIKKVDALCAECARIKDTLAVYPSDLVVFVPSWKPDYNVPETEFFTYACPLLEKDFPPTLINIYERRAWMVREKKKTVERNILFYNSDVDLAILRSMKNCKILTVEDPKMFVVTNNTLTTDSLLHYMKLDLWCNPYVH